MVSSYAQAISMLTIDTRGCLRSIPLQSHCLFPIISFPRYTNSSSPSTISYTRPSLHALLTHLQTLVECQPKMGARSHAWTRVPLGIKPSSNPSHVITRHHTPSHAITHSFALTLLSHCFHIAFTLLSHCFHIAHRRDHTDCVRLSSGLWGRLLHQLLPIGSGR